MGLAFLSISLLALTSVSMRTRASGAGDVARSTSDGAGKRTNHRLRVPAATRAPAFVARGLALMVAITVDRTDDFLAASACTAAANDCSLRGAVVFANANPGTTIMVPAGTYTLTLPGGFVEYLSGDNSIGDLDVTASGTTISGAGASSTIIRQTQPNDRVIELNPFLAASFIFDISDVTITGGRETTAVGGGGMIAGSLNNVTTITNCIFSGNSATGAGTFGGGGISYLGGNLNINGSTFSGNSTSASGGGIGYSAGDPAGSPFSTGVLTVTGSTFNSNTAASASAGGGAADLFDFNLSTSSYNFSSSSFSGNSATSGSGGAIVVESGGPLTINTCSFSANTAAGFGGAILAGGSGVSVTFSRLVGNSVTVPANGRTLFRSSGLFTADDNWWGINTGPGPNDFLSPSGRIFPATFLKLRASGSPSTICVGAMSSITADIKERNVGAALTTELNGLPAFPATFINTTPAFGSLSGVSANFVNGQASATFTGSATGTANVDVIADNQTVTASIMIQNNTTTDPADQTVCEGATATFSTTASGPGPFTFVWKKGATVLNNGDLGGRVTITSGTGSSSLSISNVQSSDADTYTVETTGECNTATQSATLTLKENTSTTDPADTAVCEGATANFSTTASGAGPFSFVWKKGATVLNNGDLGGRVTITSGSNTSSLSISNVQSSDADTYTVEATGECNTATQSATLTVQENTSTTDPADTTVCLGGTASFSTTASGTAPFSFVWKQGMTVLTNGALGGRVTIVSGSTTSTLTIANVQVGDFGNYTVETTGTCGMATQTASLSVNSTPPGITLNGNTISLWPPNHSYHTINVTDLVASASSCDGSVNLNSVVIDQVTSDEIENGNGDGNTLNDIVIGCDRKSVRLRAERNGSGDGRVYTIFFKVTDGSGQSTTVAARVTVPKSQNGTAAVDSGPQYLVVNPTCP